MIDDKGWMSMRKPAFSRGGGPGALALAGLLALGLAASPCPAGEWLDKAMAPNGPLADAGEIVFAVCGFWPDHGYVDCGHYSPTGKEKSDADFAWAFPGRGGQLAKLGLRTKEVTLLVNDPIGDVRDCSVHYDGTKVLFSYRKGGTYRFHLYEINVDGTALRQLTDGPYDDIEPTYLPNGDIVFCSNRCNQYVGCWKTQVPTLYRCKADGSGIHRISASTEHEREPSVMEDGRLIFTRWEYTDRDVLRYHHLWTSNPDGTSTMVFFGNSNPGFWMGNARNLPGTTKVVSTFSPGHGQAWRLGPMMIVDPACGPDDENMAIEVPGTPKEARDPYPLVGGWFLAAEGGNLLLMDGKGGREVLHSLKLPLWPPAPRPANAGDGRQSWIQSPGARVPATPVPPSRVESSLRELWIHSPWPIRPRRRECAVPDKVDPSATTARFYLTDVTQGRNASGIRPGTIKRLLIFEVLPKPIKVSASPTTYSQTLSQMLNRLIGTVPVEPDGSAYFEAPAMRSLSFVSLDENDLSVKRMQSSTWVMPGETVGCVGCHENRTDVARAGLPNLMAFRRRPSAISPLPEGAKPMLGYERDLQPILDRHCAKCHDYVAHDGNGPRSGGVILAGDMGGGRTVSYSMLSAAGQFICGHGDNVNGNVPPRGIGSGASPLMKKIGPRGQVSEHHSVKLSAAEWNAVWAWLELMAPYNSVYGVVRNSPVRPHDPEVAKVLQRRCYTCHTAPARKAQPEPGRSLLAIAAPREVPNARQEDQLRRGEEVLFNFSRPELSLVLLAPLARSAGGYATLDPEQTARRKQPIGPSDFSACPIVFKDSGDGDYQAILKAIQAEARRVSAEPVSEVAKAPDLALQLKLYGVLGKDFDVASPFDIRKAYEDYWRSLTRERSGSVPERSGDMRLN
jgi:hypothetical protein